MNNSDYAEKSEKKKAAPGLYQVLGAVVLDVVLVGVFFFIAMMLITIGMQISGNATENPGQLANLLMGLSALYVAILALSAWRGRSLVLPVVQNETRKNITLAVMTGFALFLFMLSVSSLLDAGGIEIKPGNQILLEDLNRRWPLLVGLYAVLVAPFFEELFFRKQIFARLTSANHAFLAYVISSVLFALMHEPSPTQGFPKWILMLVMYGFMGATFAWVYRKTGKLWPAILAHSTNNLIAMLALTLEKTMS